jgi:hypothetical protein
MSRTKKLIVLVLGLVLVSSLSIKTVNAQAGQITLNVTDDTYVDSSNPNSNYGGQKYLQIENWQYVGTSYHCIVWLKFDLSSVPSGAVVNMATLQLYTESVSETYNVHAYSCSDNSWTELTITYANMPSISSPSMDLQAVGSASQWYNWSVVDAVKNALNSNSEAVTIVLDDPSSSHGFASSVTFVSKEFANYYLTDHSAILTVHWSAITPEFPTFLILPFFMATTLLAAIFYKRRFS